MRKWISILSIVAILLGLAGCSSKGKIVVENGEYYFVLNKVISKTESPDNSSGMPRPNYLSFSSVSEMKRDFETGNFTEEELEELSEMADENGRVQIPDFSKLYEPIYPSPVESYVVQLGASGRYYFIIEYPENNAYVQLSFITKEDYDEIADITSPEKRDNITNLEKSFEAERNANIYTYDTTHAQPNHIKEIRYTITSGDKTLYVKEIYINYQENPSIRYSASIAVEYQGVYFHFIIDPDERPSVEWLSSFGVKEYVETSTQ